MSDSLPPSPFPLVPLGYTGRPPECKMHAVGSWVSGDFFKQKINSRVEDKDLHSADSINILFEDKDFFSNAG